MAYFFLNKNRPPVSSHKSEKARHQDSAYNHLEYGPYFVDMVDHLQSRIFRDRTCAQSLFIRNAHTAHFDRSKQKNNPAVGGNKNGRQDNIGMLADNFVIISNLRLRPFSHEMPNL